MESSRAAGRGGSMPSDAMRVGASYNDGAGGRGGVDPILMSTSRGYEKEQSRGSR